MDAFKQNEILRMQYGGNKAWQDFYNKNSPIPFDEATIKERYDSEIGEEWKERLTAQVEDREFDKAAFLKERQAILQKQASRSQTPAGGVRSTNNNLASGPGSRTASPAPGKSGITAEQKAQNEAYFARMGEANASRPDDLPPSQGGKFAGFGSAPLEPQRSSGGGSIPSADEFSKDPVGALTKGFGWLSAAVGKQAKVVNDSYIQPTAKNVCSGVPSLKLEHLLTFWIARFYRLCRTSTECGARGRQRHPDRCERRGRVVQQVCRRTGREGQLCCGDQGRGTRTQGFLG